MRILIQRVSSASVKVDEKIVADINDGLLILVGIEDADDETDADWLARKAVNLRIFNDEQGVMNRSVIDTNGDIIVVSQFTLHALTAKGNRPSYIKASKPPHAVPMYELFCSRIEELIGKPIERGIFGADMKVKLLNDGPVTIWIDSKNRE